MLYLFSLFNKSLSTCHLRKVKICSVHLLRFLNPVCSFLSRWSMMTEIRRPITFANILLGINGEMIQIQLLHSLVDPFFGVFIILPTAQLWFHFPFFIMFKSGSKILAASSGSTLNISALRFLRPGTLLFSKLWVATNKKSA